MNLRNEINRLSHYFNDGVDKMQTVADDLTHRAKATARREMERGTTRLASAEERTLAHLRSNSAFYIAGIALLLGIAVANLLRPRPHREPEIPLL